MCGGGYRSKNQSYIFGALSSSVYVSFRSYLGGGVIYICIYLLCSKSDLRSRRRISSVVGTRGDEGRGRLPELHWERPRRPD